MLLIYIFLAEVGLRCCMGFSLFVGGGDYSLVGAQILVVVSGLLIAEASLVAEHWL